MVFKACHDPLVLCRFYAVGNMILVPQWFILGLFGYGIWKANRSEIYPPDIQVTWSKTLFKWYYGTLAFPLFWKAASVQTSGELEGEIHCPDNDGGDFPGQFLYPNCYGKSPGEKPWHSPCFFRVAGSGTWNPQIQGTKSSSTSRPLQAGRTGYNLGWKLVMCNLCVIF